MLKTVAFGILILIIVFSLLAMGSEFTSCDCEEEGFWTTETIMDIQKVADFLIAVAYFSIPIEILWFVSCLSFPFKWFLFEFIAFIVLCGMTHFLNSMTFKPHSYQLQLALTIFKGLTGIVSFATAITFFTLIPMLLKVKAREFMLKKKTWDLGEEVKIIKKKRETGWHVRMLTREIRKSLDRHTILHTTLVELSKTLQLENCVVWMPNEGKTHVNLIHEARERGSRSTVSIPITDQDVQDVKASDDVNILGSESVLAAASCEGFTEHGDVAAIRMPILRVANFKGGTPEMVHVCYALLVLVPYGGSGRFWCAQELEIIKVVAGQVTVALSHAAVLEESQLMGEKLVEQNRALMQARQATLMASQARNSFQKVTSDGMRKPMHSIMGLLSMMQDETLGSEQRLIADAMAKTSNVLSTLINDAMDLDKGNGRFPFEVKSFNLHSLIKEAACLVKCLSIYSGCSFEIDFDRSLPGNVMGDERRVFQVILHMVGSLLNGRSGGGGGVKFRVFKDGGGSQGKNDLRRAARRPSSSSDGYVHVKFEMGIKDRAVRSEGETSKFGAWRYSSRGIEDSLGFGVCKKLVQLMQGHISVIPNSNGFDQRMALALRFQLRQSVSINISEPGSSSTDNALFRGLEVLVAEGDNVNLYVTKKLLLNLGCSVSVASTGYECISAVRASVTPFKIVLLDLQMPDMDGFDVASRIRKFTSHSWPMIIASVTSADADMWEKCLQVEMNGLVRKPFTLEGIADELRRVLLLANVLR